MTAIVEYVLGEHWTDPEIQWMSVSRDGLSRPTRTSLAMLQTSTGISESSRSAAPVSPEEREVFSRLFRERVDDHRPTPTRPDYAELLH